MGNMSYCRFHNTSLDLKQCEEVLAELFDGSAPEPLSREETQAAKRLIRTCVEVARYLADRQDENVFDLGSNSLDKVIGLELDKANKAANDNAEEIDKEVD